MPVNLKVPEKAMHDLLTNVDVHYADNCDAIRAEALADLLGSELGVYVSTRPQLAGNMAIVIERAAGQAHGALNVFSACAQPIIDVGVWWQDDTERASYRKAAEVAALLHIILEGRNVTAAGVEITDIGREAEPFMRSNPPIDGSDNWTPSLITPYVVTYRQATATTVNGI